MSYAFYEMYQFMKFWNWLPTHLNSTRDQSWKHLDSTLWKYISQMATVVLKAGSDTMQAQASMGIVSANL